MREGPDGAMATEQHSATWIEPRTRWYRRGSWLVLLALLVIAMMLSASVGAYSVGSRQALHIVWDHTTERAGDVPGWAAIASAGDWFAGLPVVATIGDWLEPVREWLLQAYTPREDAVIWQIRAPRVFLGAVVGGAMALATVLLQAAFRNPLADPGLVGVASSGALAALTVSLLPVAWFAHWSPWTFRLAQPGAAALACLATLLVLWLVARQLDAVEPLPFVLTGVAVNAVAIAAIGLVNAIDGDTLGQATSFWASGGLSQAAWYPVRAVALVLLFTVILAALLARPLTVLSLGDLEARHLGVRVDFVRWGAVLIAAALLGVAATHAGSIAFLGLIASQAARLWLGPDLRRLLVPSMLAGGLTLVLADLGARTIADPVELGLGLVLTLVGGPLFVVMLVQLRGRQGGLA